MDCRSSRFCRKEIGCMWKCPKCGRSFKNENQSHYCGSAPETIDEYIQAQDEGIRDQLQYVREAIRDALPNTTEKISWAMPTYWKGRNIIHFAAFKDHIGIYPGGEATTVFSDKLKGYKTSKGTIQIRHDQELPLELIKEIAVWCYGRYAK